MNYSNNTVFQYFIEQLIEALKYENECREPNGGKVRYSIFDFLFMPRFRK